MDPKTFNYPRITDFDFGVSENLDEFVRVASLGENDVTLPEVKLITWILLEKAWSNYAEEERHSLETGTDETDGSVEKRNRIETDGGKKRSAEIKRAKQYSLDLLRFVGVNIPFENLTDDDKSRLLEQFSSSSELVSKERFTSINELYEVLRRRSKFREQFEVLQNIGEGRYGKVKLVKAKNSSQDRSAIKRITPAIDSLGDIKMILTESQTLKKLKGHPHVVDFRDSWLAMDSTEDDQDDGFIDDCLVFYLNMELCEESLKEWKKQLLKENAKPADFEQQCEHILIQILDGLSWIHGNGILHLDLNPSNIFWKDKSHRILKIGDFGLAVHGTEIDGRRGTSPYCAPESILTAKSDIFSAGVTIFELAELTRTLQELCSRVDKLDITTNFKILDAVIPEMLSKEPAERPTARQLFSKVRELKKPPSQCGD